MRGVCVCCVCGVVEGVVEVLCTCVYVCVCHTEEGGMGGMGVCKRLWMNRTGESDEVYLVCTCKDGRRGSLCPNA